MKVKDLLPYIVDRVDIYSFVNDDFHYFAKNVILSSVSDDLMDMDVCFLCVGLDGCMKIRVIV